MRAQTKFIVWIDRVRFRALVRCRYVESVNCSSDRVPISSCGVQPNADSNWENYSAVESPKLLR